MVKNTFSITLCYIFFNMNRRIYLPCLQLTSKTYVWWIVTRTPLFSNPDQKWKTYLTPTVERQKNKTNKNNKNYQLKSVPNLNHTFSITLGYIFFNMNRRIYLPCLQLTSKKYFWWIVTRTPLFFSSKVEEWLMMIFYQ
jgi:hypothetical protein